MNESGIIVNDRHAARVKRLFDDAIAHGAKVASGGTFDGRAIAPTVLTTSRPIRAVMQEEIFGPLLPVVPYNSLDEALRIIAEREKPLVLYLFSRSRAVINDVLSRHKRRRHRHQRHAHPLLPVEPPLRRRRRKRNGKGARPLRLRSLLERARHPRTADGVLRDAADVSAVHAVETEADRFDGALVVSKVFESGVLAVMRYTGIARQ